VVCARRQVIVRIPGLGVKVSNRVMTAYVAPPAVDGRRSIYRYTLTVFVIGSAGLAAAPNYCL
jgi:hypothetical protein